VQIKPDVKKDVYIPLL